MRYILQYYYVKMKNDAWGCKVIYTVCCEGVLSKSTARKRSDSFYSGNFDVKDMLGSARPMAEKVDDTLEKVR